MIDERFGKAIIKLTLTEEILVVISLV